MIRYKPLFSIVGALSGLLLGLSVLALAHQNGSLYPTRVQAIVFAVVGLLVCGIVLPSFTRWLKVRKVNGRIGGAGAS
jgi:hypothetical protein